MEWIPVGERLPEDDNFVLITVQLGGTTYLPIVHRKLAYYDCNVGWLFSYSRQVQDKVLAWMPLPEPYEVE